MGSGKRQGKRDKKELGHEGLRNQKARVEPLKDFKKSTVMAKLTVTWKMDWGGRDKTGERIWLEDSHWNLSEKW